MSGLLGLLNNLTPMRITQWGSNSDQEHEKGEDREPAEFFNGANVVSSQRRYRNRFGGYFTSSKQRHAVAIDLDVPAYLVPSSTEGHSHLYIDVDCSEKDYFAFLDAAVRCGVLEPGYVSASKNKGGTYLRLPWVRKGVDGK